MASTPILIQNINQTKTNNTKRLKTVIGELHKNIKPRPAPSLISWQKGKSIKPEKTDSEEPTKEPRKKKFFSSYKPSSITHPLTSRPKLPHSEYEGKRHEFKKEMHALRLQYRSELLEKYGSHAALHRENMKRPVKVRIGYDVPKPSPYLRSSLSEQEIQKKVEAIHAEREGFFNSADSILDLSTAHKFDLKQYREAKKKKGKENLEKQRNSIREKRLQDCIKLYYNAGSFVTMSNLDQKIEEVFNGEARPPLFQNLPTLTAQLAHGGGIVSMDGIDKRVEQIRDVLDGTVHGGKYMGLEGVLEADVEEEVKKQILEKQRAKEQEDEIERLRVEEIEKMKKEESDKIKRQAAFVRELKKGNVNLKQVQKGKEKKK